MKKAHGKKLENPKRPFQCLNCDLKFSRRSFLDRHMKSSEKTAPTKCEYCDFNKWYIQNKDIKYNFKKELEDYCISDVDILAKGLKVFRNDMMAINKNIDPLSSITIAGYCMKLYKSFHAPSEEQLDYINTIPEDKQELIYKTKCDGEQTAFSILKQNEYDLIKRVFGKRSHFVILCVLIFFFLNLESD